ncbi:beta-lactamase [Leptospira ryugenii]|uniref:Beta-lactamase n=1 Tax=Leptospira ryugenii TaxID=1917863 RepID=A0A2P2DZI1_9LEPT|nr:serine hydrolase domain-containing protein [Leptospira ryugenii]GBF50032.1 beta-lactamase [Leptospira ryugenii]
MIFHFSSKEYSKICFTFIVFLFFGCLSIPETAQKTLYGPEIEEILSGLVGSKSKSITFAFQDGLDIKESGFLGKETKPHRYKIGSVTKLFTTIAVLQLRDRGKLSLDDPLARYIPELKKIPKQNKNARDFTIRDVLKHQSGLPSDLSYEFFLDSASKYTDIQKARIRSLSILKDSQTAEPGQYTSYSNLGFGLLGILIERTSNLDIETYFQKNIFEVAGMEHSSLVDEAQSTALIDGYEGILFSSKVPKPIIRDLTAGSLSTTGADMQRFFAAFFRSKQNRNGLISANSFREMHRLQSPSPLDFSFQIGLTVMLDDFQSNGKSVKLAFHSGSLPPYAAHWLYDPESEISVFIAGNQFPAHIQDIPGSAEKIFKVLWKKRFGNEIHSVQDKKSLRKSIFRPGLYASSNGIIEVKEEGEKRELIFSGLPLQIEEKDGAFYLRLKAFFGLFDLTPKELESWIVEMEETSKETILTLQSSSLKKGVAGVGILNIAQTNQIDSKYLGTYRNLEAFPILTKVNLYFKDNQYCVIAVNYRLANWNSKVDYLCKVLDPETLLIEGKGRNLNEIIKLKEKDGKVILVHSGVNFEKD